MKLVKDLKACLPGEIYPRTFAAGEECPKELEKTARALDALEVPKQKDKDKK